jgi:hypothetical protein
LCVDVVCADEGTVVDGLAEEQPPVPGEELPPLVSRAGGELGVISIRTIGHIDAQ